jgi:hypothetical protein
VVRLAERERLAHARRGRLPHLDEEPAAPFSEREPFAERPRAEKPVELADELPRLEVDQVVTAFLAVELLQYDDGKGVVVVL